MSHKKQNYFDSIAVRVLSIFTALICCLIFLLFVRFHINHQVTGDEPHYLLMDYSLQHDHDLNLKNNYQNPKDYFSFFPANLSPDGQVDGHQLATNSPKQYSIHGIGLPILTLPAFVINEAKSVEVEMVFLAVVVVWLAGLWCFEVTNNLLLSCFAAGLLPLCYFFNGLAGYIYPDMIIAGLTLASLLILYKRYEKIVFQLLFGALIGSLVYFHFKTLSISAPLFVLMVYRNYSNEKKFPWAVLLTAGPLLIYFFFSLHHWYGVWNPARIYSSNINIHSSPLEIVPAMLFDSKLGLLVYNPVLLLLFVGLFPWIKRNKTSFILVVLSLLPSILLLTIFNGWDGGEAPAGRYIIDFLPAFLPAIVFTFELAKARWQRIVVSLLVLMTITITVESITSKTPYVDDTTPKHRASLFIELQNQTGVAFDKFFPKYSTKSQKSTYIIDKYGLLKVSIASVGLLALVGYGRLLAKPRKPLHYEARI